jgi:predicted DsbA family dithiol-disulfide isomerase
MTTTASLPEITVDIVSDVVCPWCIIGYKKLEAAMQQFAGRARFAVAWHAFELNPWMPPEGQNINEHMQQKYGASPEQSARNRERLKAACDGLDFTFQMGPDSRMVNTFDAHRLLHWAGESGHQTALKLALFAAHFSDGEDVSDHRVLAERAEAVGLNRQRAESLLASDLYADDVRAVEAQWQDRFISGVPAFIFNGKYMVPGAQDSDVFVNIIEKKLLAA